MVYIPRLTAKKQAVRVLCFVILIASASILGYDDVDFVPEQQYNNTTHIRSLDDSPSISDIVIEGLKHNSPESLKAKVALTPGEILTPSLSARTIKNIYALGLFKPDIKVYLEPVDEQHARLVIALTEKDRLEKIIYKGNAHLKESEIEKELHISERKTIDQSELPALIEQLTKLYVAKDYHHSSIEANLVESGDGLVQLEVDIDEGPTSMIKRVIFKGNKNVPSKKLRSLIFTREEWLFGFIRKAGSLQPEALDYDKHVIENFYQSNGFMSARVTDVAIEEDKKEHKYTVTFTIEEGDIYTLEEVKAVGNEVMCEEDILLRTPLRAGELYSRERIRMAMERLKLMWGEYGYIYADVNPAIEPHPDRKTVTINFISELGSPITVNRITIVGNKKTRDYVIRRNIIFNEGEQLTTYKMDESKRRIEQLGYFDPKGGVNWRIIKLDEETADLELTVKEVKTGQLYSQIGFGGLGTTDSKREDVESERRDDAETKESPSHSFKIGLGIKDSNFLGMGILWNINGLYSQQERNILVNISNPWMLNRPISSGLDLAVRNVKYDEFFNVTSTPTEQSESISGNIGFRAKALDNALTVIDAGFEKIQFNNRPGAVVPLTFENFRTDFQNVVNQRFQSGTTIWTGLSLTQDMRNHPMYPTNGYLWAANLRFAVPHHRENFAFFKTELDARWYTPLIEQYDLVFHIHGHLGFIKEFQNYNVPYRELFHVGGPTTVRGFNFGQCGPNLGFTQNNPGSSIGATKEFFVNVELQFPIKLDMSMRAVLFYDGGCGWDTPKAQCINSSLLRNNHFNYRHTIGFGVRMTYPTPVRIDWGFKLDRNKRRGESASEMHFTVLQEF